MSNNNNDRPVWVTGQERRHPALRILARACISIAREQLERDKVKTKETPDSAVESQAEPKEVPHE